VKDLSIVIPCYNEEAGIKNTIKDLIPYAANNNWEIIVVNDGSNDKTGEILNAFNNDVIIIDHPYNKGYGASLKTGILQTKSKLVAFYDADGQHRPVDLLNLFNNLMNFDMLVGQRGKESHQDWIRKPGKWVLSKIANYLTERQIPDLNSGLRIIKTDVIKKILHLLPQGFSFSTTSTIALMNFGFNVGYMPIIVNKRIGKSSVKQIKHGSQTIILILRLIVLFNPLKVFLPTSIWFVVIGFIYELLYGVYILYPNVKLIPAAFFMIITGVLVFFFGLIADQISALRLHNTFKNE